MVAAGHAQRVELDGAEAIEGLAHAIQVGRERARRREKMARHQEAARRGRLDAPCGVGHAGSG